MTAARMQQMAWGYSGDECLCIKMPSPDTELMLGINWGCVADLLSPAFWKYQVQMHRNLNLQWRYNLGRTLIEEVAVCLLGGYGMPAELGLAAFRRLQVLGMLNGEATSEAIEQQLQEPFLIGGKARRYRFPRQKAKYLSSSLRSLAAESVPADAVALRDYLTTLKGIGPKTASWVVRNHLGANDVAILDIHIIRAGIHIGLYDTAANPAQHYHAMERTFLDFCDAIEEPASLVDAIMWDYMRRLGTLSHLGRVQLH